MGEKILKIEWCYNRYMETVILHPQAFARTKPLFFIIGKLFSWHHFVLSSIPLCWTRFTDETTLLSASRQQSICRTFLLLYPSKSADRDQSGKLQFEKRQFKIKLHLKVRLSFSDVSGGLGSQSGTLGTRFVAGAS